MAEPPPVRRERWTLIGGAIVAAVSLFSIGFGLVVLPILQAPNAGIDPWTAICRAMGVKPGSPAQRQPPMSATAAPVSQVRWTARTLGVLAAADPRPGAALAQSLCSACHGDDGRSPSPLYPHLSGQSAEAIFKQLSDFRSGARVNPMMTPVAKQLTEDQLGDVAAYYAHYTKDVVLGPRYETPDPWISRLAHRGDPARHIPPCEGCHARDVGGPREAPVLWGQQSDYLTRQLEAYAGGDRRNDVYRRMRDIAQRLTPEERRRLGEFYQGLL
jgi:cytochrome c553